MKKILQLILLITLTTSCEQSKKYEYVEIGLKESLFGGTERDEKNTVTIRAKNDSIAYLKAFKEFCISEKVSQDMREALGSSSSVPTDFKLIDEQGNNVALLIDFSGIDSLKNDIRKRIFDIQNSLKETVKNNKQKEIEDFKKMVQIDSTKIKKLDNFFTSETDEFDPNALVWYIE